MNTSNITRDIFRNAGYLWAHLTGATVLNAVLYACLRAVGYSEKVGFEFAIATMLFSLVIPLLVSPHPSALRARVVMASQLVLVAVIWAVVSLVVWLHLGIEIISGLPGLIAGWGLVVLVVKITEEFQRRRERPESTRDSRIDIWSATRPVEEFQEPAHLEPKLHTVPIVGIVRAGPGRLAKQKGLGLLSLDAEIFPHITHVIGFQGVSMVGEGIYPGDFVLVREQQWLERGELGVFLITYAGELTETTLKHFYPEADHVCLKSMNEAEPIMLIIPRHEDASRIIKQYEQQGCTVHPYVDADIEIVARAYGLFRIFAS